MTGHQASAQGAAKRYEVRSNFFAPPAQFDGCFTSFYQAIIDVDDGGVLHDHLQPEWANLRFFSGSLPVSQVPGKPELRDARFTATGPSTLPVRFELGTCRMWGIGILPLGWSRLLDTDARDVVNVICDGAMHPAFRKFAPMQEVLCDDSVPDQQQFDFIVECMNAAMRPNRDEDKIVRVHRAMVDSKLTSVADFADLSGMSVRTLERLCHRYFGFSPKLLMRRQRFMRSLTDFLLHDGKKWTEVMDDHYHDQAQFTREFHEFMTMNPSDYAALDHPVLSAFIRARAKIWGSPAQTLDKPG